MKGVKLSGYATLAKEDGEPVLIIRPEGSKHKERKFPATRKGCRDAGFWMAQIGIESYMSSSSLDFPEEYDVKCDPQEEISYGYTKMVEEWRAKLVEAYFFNAQGDLDRLNARFRMALEAVPFEKLEALCDECEIEI